MGGAAFCGKSIIIRKWWNRVFSQKGHFRGFLRIFLATLPWGRFFSSLLFCLLARQSKRRTHANRYETRGFGAILPLRPLLTCRKGLKIIFPHVAILNFSKFEFWRNWVSSARAQICRAMGGRASSFLSELGSSPKMALRLRCRGFSRLFRFFSTPFSQTSSGPLCSKKCHVWCVHYMSPTIQIDCVRLIWLKRQQSESDWQTDPSPWPHCALQQNMAIQDADPSLVIKWKSLGKWPLPWQMIFILKPLTQTQQTADDADQDHKHKSRLVICGNLLAWGEHSATTTNLDAPLLRLMLSLACSPDTTWSNTDITIAFLNADIHDDDTVLVTPPPILVKWTLSSPTPSGKSRKPSMDFDKHHIYGNKREREREK